MNRRIAPLVSSVCVLTGLWLAVGCRRDASAADQELSAPIAPVPVRCVAASVTTLRPSVDLVGTLINIPEQTALLSVQVPGQVQSIAVVDGQSVQAGDLLFQMDERLAAAQRAKARAVFDESQAMLMRLRQGARPEELDAARQEVRRAETNLAFARTKLESGQALHDSKSISGLEFAQRQSAVEAAEAEVAASQARLKLLEIGARPEEIAEAEAKAAAAAADLSASELALDLMRITAPIDGVVTDLLVRQGMYVSAGAALLTLSDARTMFARTRVPTAYLARVSPGGKVDVRAPAFPEDVFPGAVIRIGRQADERTGDVDAFVSVTNADGKLRPGLACRVRLWLPEIRDAIAVPVAAVADRDGTPVVTVVRDEKAHEVEVQLGGRTREMVQVTEGVHAGDLVAVEGGYGLPDGCPCKVVPAEAASGKSPIAEDER